jgi:hypothetical protein
VSEGIAVDQPGRAVVTRFTCSDDFPTSNALQPTLAGGADDFVAQFAADGMTLRYSTHGDGRAAFRKNEQGPAQGLNGGRPFKRSAGWVEALRKPSLGGFECRVYQPSLQ